MLVDEEVHLPDLGDVSIICCRYDENVDWLKRLSPDISVYLYNKGEKLHLEDYSNIHQFIVPNIGRESEAYLRYIFENYDTLSSDLIFTQGNPLTHNPQFFALIQKLGNKYVDYKILPLTYRWNEDLPPAQIVERFQNSFYLEEMSRYTMAPSTFYDEGMREYCMDYLKGHDLKIGNDVVHHFCNLIGLKDAKEPHKFFYSACFALKKESILQHSRQFYFRCHTLLMMRPAYGVMFERMWYKIFS